MTALIATDDARKTDGSCHNLSNTNCSLTKKKNFSAQMKPLEVDNCSSERRAHYFLRTELPDSLISPSVAASVDWTVKGAFKINSDSEFSSKKSQVDLLPRTRHASSSVCVKRSSQWTSTEDLVPTYIPQHCWQWRSEEKVYDHLVMGWWLLSPVNEGWSIFILQMWNLKSNVISDKSIVSSVASGRFQRFVPLKKKKTDRFTCYPPSIQSSCSFSDEVLSSM